MAKQLDPKPNQTQDGLSALNHPTRRQILRALIEAAEPTSPRELSDVIETPLSGVSYHTRILASCGAVTLVRTEPVRGAMQHFYSPAPEFVSIPWVATALDVPVADERPEAEAA